MNVPPEIRKSVACRLGKLLASCCQVPALSVNVPTFTADGALILPLLLNVKDAAFTLPRDMFPAAVKRLTGPATTNAPGTKSPVV